MDHPCDLILKADNRIARAEMAVMLQIVEIDKLRVAGRDTAVAERALLAFVESLKAMRERRKLIAQRITHNAEDNALSAPARSGSLSFQHAQNLNQIAHDPLDVVSLLPTQHGLEAMRG